MNELGKRFELIETSIHLLMIEFTEVAVDNKDFKELLDKYSSRDQLQLGLIFFYIRYIYYTQWQQKEKEMQQNKKHLGM